MDNNFRSKLSLKREEERKGEKVQNFKNEIEKFLKDTEAPEDISYQLRKDLGIMTNMPYYKEYKGIRNRMDKKKIIMDYAALLMEYDNPSFTAKLINALSLNQLQTLRKLSPKSKNEIDRSKNIGSNNGVWEHPVPIKYIKEELIKLINDKDFNELNKFLDFIINNTNQIFLTKDEDNKVNSIYKSDMPPGWNWKTGNVYQRYIDAGIRQDLYN